MILFLFGLSMVISLALIIIHYYTKKRVDRDKIEAPKYSMMQDDDDTH